MNRILISLFALAAFSCAKENKSLQSKSANKGDSHTFGNFPQEDVLVYGEYYFQARDISLELAVPNKFELAYNEFDGGHMIVTKSYAFGQFTVRNDTIILIDSLTQKRFYLLRKSDERLVSLVCDSVPLGQSFLCWTKRYSSGKVKFTGGWEDNKKDGGWRYFDEKGKETIVFYEKGEVDKAIINKADDDSLSMNRRN
jgi:hypothetical protein